MFSAPFEHNKQNVEKTAEAAPQTFVSDSYAVSDFSSLLRLQDSFDCLNAFSQSLLNGKTELFYCIQILQGCISLEINGEEEIVTAKSQLMISPENSIIIREVSSDISYFMIAVHPKITNEIFDDLSFPYSNTRFTLKHLVSPLSEEQSQRSLELYNEIKHDLIGPNYKMKYIYLRSMLCALFVEGINIHYYFPMLLQGKSESRLYNVYCRFITLLNTHAAEHRSVEYYANLLGISSKYLSFVCISYSNKNASAWINETVIQKAKILMQIHGLSLTETSQALHFLTPNSFSRYFKRATGMTPRSFIKSQKQNN